MDQRELVEKTRSILNKIIQEKGSVNMAMLIPDKKTDTYTLLISSKWLDSMSPYNGTKLIANYFFEDSNKIYFSKISKINLISTNDETMEHIYRTMHVSQSVVIVENCIFFNVEIDNMILFESHRD